MQPYIFPYIGYFQLINTVDKFVVYDNIQFTKKGWINRNRILINGKEEYITLPLKKDSDYLNIDQRVLSDVFKEQRNKILRKINESYKKAPGFKTAFPLITEILNYEEGNLFRFIFNSIQRICNFLEIDTEFIISSSLAIDHNLRSQDKVIAICKELCATTYINPPGGIQLYSKETFDQNNINLKFIKPGIIEYHQFDNTFVHLLSIIDVMMFNSKEKIQQYLTSSYTLTQA
jgi:hypothetical protein